jgi:hypothetical protein
MKLFITKKVKVSTSSSSDQDAPAVRLMFGFGTSFFAGTHSAVVLSKNKKFDC